MKNIIFLLFLSAILAVALILAAFFYIDFSLHESSDYDVTVDGKLFGTVEVDRFVTEDKVIYKSRSDMPYLMSYRFASEKLLLKKNGRFPLRFIREENNGRGVSRLILLVQNFDRTDYLFLEPPKFLALQGFETGEKTLVFLPRDVMTYMALMEKYNFWKKGTQFFEVMVPVGDAVPLMRDKIEVKEIGDEFVSVMGRKVEGEAFRIRSRGIPEVKITLAKYTHSLLTLQFSRDGMKFTLAAQAEDPGTRLKALLRHATREAKVSAGLNEREAQKVPQAVSSDTPDAPEAILRRVFSTSATDGKSREVFFESGGLILSGRVWMPKGAGVFPSVIIVPKDGPVTNGWQMLSAAYGEALSDRGYVVMTYDSPGQGKSQGDLLDLDSEKALANFKAAVEYLRKDPLVSREPVFVIGYRDSGFAALEALSAVPDLGGGVVLGISGVQEKAYGTDTKNVRDKVQQALENDGIGPFDAGYMNTITLKMEKQLESVNSSTDEFAYFAGAKLPEGAYRRTLERKMYKSILATDKPLLMVTGKNDPDYEPAAIDAIRKSASSRNARLKMAVFNSLDPLLGKMVPNGESWSFVADEDVLDSVAEWLAQNRTAVPEDKPAPAVIQAPPGVDEVQAAGQSPQN